MKANASQTGNRSEDSPKAARKLELVLSHDSEPISLEFLEDGRTVTSRCMLDDGQQSPGLSIVERLAPEIGGRPDVFTDRILFISLHAVGRDQPNDPRDARLVKRVASRLLPRLREMVEVGDLLLEISVDSCLLVSPHRDADRCGRWSEHCAGLAKPLLGEERADSIRVYGLKGGSAGRLVFHAPDEYRSPNPDPGTASQGVPRPLAGSQVGRDGAHPRWTMYSHEEAAPKPTRSFQFRRLKLDAFDVRFTPTWDTRNEIVSVFTAEPVRRAGKHVQRGFQAIPEALNDDKLLMELCRALLSASADQVRAFVGDGLAGVIAVPTHFDALATSWRLTQYMRLLREIEPEVSQRLCIVVTDVPVGVNGYMIQSIIDTLRVACRAVFLRIGLNDPDWAMRLVSRVHAIGIEFRSDAPHEEERIRHLERFAVACRKRKVDAYATGLNSTSLVLSAAAAGIRYISGDRIMQPLLSPQGACRYDWMDFYSQAGS